MTGAGVTNRAGLLPAERRVVIDKGGRGSYLPANPVQRRENGRFALFRAFCCGCPRQQPLTLPGNEAGRNLAARHWKGR